jgi:hypothetical protein
MSLRTSLRILHAPPAPMPARPAAIPADVDIRVIADEREGRFSGRAYRAAVPADVDIHVIEPRAGHGLLAIACPEARRVLHPVVRSIWSLGFRVSEFRYSASPRRGRWSARIVAKDNRLLSAIRRLLARPPRTLIVEAASDGRLRVHILGTADARILNAFVENLRRRGLELRVEEGGLP